MPRREYQYKSKHGDYMLYIDQKDDVCTAITADTGEPFARLSVVVPKRSPIEGWFYLKWWTENSDLVEQLVAAGILQTRDDGVVPVSPLVNTMEARVVERT